MENPPIVNKTNIDQKRHALSPSESFIVVAFDGSIDDFLSRLQCNRNCCKHWLNWHSCKICRTNVKHRVGCNEAVLGFTFDAVSLYNCTCTPIDIRQLVTFCRTCHRFCYTLGLYSVHRFVGLRKSIRCHVTRSHSSTGICCSFSLFQSIFSLFSCAVFIIALFRVIYSEFVRLAAGSVIKNFEALTE